MVNGATAGNLRARRLATAALTCVAALIGHGLAWGADEAATVGILQWRSGARATEKQEPAALAQTLAATSRAGTQRVVIQFERPLMPSERQQLEATGVRLLNYVGDNAFFATIDGTRVDPGRVAQMTALRCVLPIERNWKLHPDLAAGVIHEWALVNPPKDNGQPAPAPIVAAYVLFHPDVPMSEGVRIAQRHGAFIRSTLQAINGLVIELPAANILALADEDGVQSVEPPLPKFSMTNNDNRRQTGVNTVQAAPYGLDGTGVDVMVYDGGTGRSTHQDFGGRLHVRDTSGTVDHSTHVAGTIGGSGAASSGTYKGMAPAVTFEAYGFEQAGGLQQGFLYTDPGDMQNDYSQAINTYGADLASNSIGTNTAPNGYPCEWEGNYGVTSALIDTIVRAIEQTAPRHSAGG